jgi:hypothetical protein
LHIRVHPVIGQDADDVDAVREGQGGGRHSCLGGTGKNTWGHIVAVSGAEIEEPLDVLATPRDRAVTCRIAHETTGSMEGLGARRARSPHVGDRVDRRTFASAKKEGL